MLSRHFPEHSISGYNDCYLGGCDFIELDLQLTKDGYLVANHDPTLDMTTDISEYASLFSSRLRKLVTIDGTVY
jgi:glycerophosphoryl diester phosphodiesterase